MIPLAEEVFANIGVPRLEVLVTGHFPHRFQHWPPALFLDGLPDNLPHHRLDILRVKKGYLEVGRQAEQGLHTPAPHTLHPFGPQGQGVGQAPDGAPARVMLLPAAEAEVRKGQRRHGIHDLVQKGVALDDLGPFRGGVQLPHAPGQLAEDGTADEQVMGEHIDQRQVADGTVIGKLVDSGHKVDLLPCEMFSISIYLRHKYIPNVPILQNYSERPLEREDKKHPTVLQHIGWICYNNTS